MSSTRLWRRAQGSLKRLITSLRDFAFLRGGRLFHDELSREKQDNASDKAGDDHLAWIARAITSWAIFERGVDVLLWTAIGTKLEIGACVSSEIQSWRTKIIIIEKIMELEGVSNGDVRKVRAFRNRMEELGKRRNRLVHDPVLMFEGKPFRVGAPELAADRMYGKPLSINELHDFSVEVLSKGGEFYALCKCRSKIILSLWNRL